MQFEKTLSLNPRQCSGLLSAQSLLRVQWYYAVQMSSTRLCQTVVTFLTIIFLLFKPMP